MKDETTTPPVPFDYDALQERTTIPAMNAVWKIFGENADLISFNRKMTAEMITNNQAVVVQKILETLVAFDVPECDMKIFVESFQVVMFQIFDALARQKNELEKEFLARSIGAQDPGTGKFSREYAGLKDLFSALMQVRTSQDADGVNHYFYNRSKVAKPAEPKA